MPPKRKRAGDAAFEASNPSTRVTRSSARTRSRTATAEAEGTPTPDVPDMMEPTLQAKRPRKTTTKTTGTRNKVKAVEQSIAQNPRAVETAKQEAPTSNASKIPKTTPASDQAPYSSATAISLFSSYADPDDPTVIGPEGFERLCSDANISLEGALPLLLAWQVNASEMAKISKSEWEKGMSELQISNLATLSLALRDLEDVLLLGKPHLKSTAPAHVKKKSASATSICPEPYNRARYSRYAVDTKKAFNELYHFCFLLAKPPEARNIDMDTASAFWTVLLVPKYPLMSDITQFIGEKGTYKGVNKDLWTMTLEFCRAVQPDLSNYDAEGAWPTLLDDFVTWKQSN